MSRVLDPITQVWVDGLTESANEFFKRGELEQARFCWGLAEAMKTGEKFDHETIRQASAPLN
ncbi:hypothetical protein [Hyphococcus sp.]|uniref:hypothetical protein n=1 Tax=Hyphococcus sp. TaxID=2038636 RepID=UPI00208BCCA1|nr:MAG: hypothetical protein DHS20C04_30500 [Marinicaulis sp.]